MNINQKEKLAYTTPEVKVVSFIVEGGFGDSDFSQKASLQRMSQHGDDITIGGASTRSANDPFERW